MTAESYDAAAVLLADAWAPALELAFRLGHAAGYRDAERDTAAAWATAAKPIRDLLTQPAQDELAKRRAPAYKPCRSRCGRCATCVCAEAYERRGGRQYLGEELEALMAQTAAAS